MLKDTLQNKKIQKVAGVVILLIVLLLVSWYMVRDLSIGSDKAVDETTGGKSIDELIESGDAEVEELPTEDSSVTVNVLQGPNLGRTFILPERFTPEAAEILVNNITTLTSQIQENPDAFGSWNELAVQYKVIDDFRGAEEVWEYLIVATEDNTLARVNLGNLYHYQLRDFEKSEKVFKAALEVDDTVVDAYTGLHELYRYSYKTDTTLAVDILKEGIVAIPNSIDLRMVLASYYTKLGRKDEANNVYEEALGLAQSAGNTNLVTIIQAAIESLK